MGILSQLKNLKIFQDERYFLLQEKSEWRDAIPLFIVLAIGTFTVYYNWERWDFIQILLLWVLLNAIISLYHYFNTDVESDVIAFEPEKEPVLWYVQLWNIIWIIIRIILAYWFLTDYYEKWFEIDVYEKLYFIVPIVLSLVYITLPSKQRPAIYKQNQDLKFHRDSRTYYQIIKDFEEIRISNDIISMKSTNGKVDHLIGYDFSPNQQVQLKRFFERTTSEINIVIYEA